jgi:LysR family transcriptional regulator, glycine cleavage system transcriptional activator
VRRLPPLNALPAFEATARLGSANKAAQELGRTHGAISKQLKVLAGALGYSLFRNEGNKLVLTPQGETFLASVGPALDQLSQSFEDARMAAPKSVLRLGVSATFGTRWLMPRLPQFYKAHPGIEIEFRMSGRTPVEVNDQDLGISWDRLRYSADRWPYESVADVAFGVVHAPGYHMSSDGSAHHVSTRLIPDTLPTVWEVWGKLSGVTVLGSRDMIIPQTGLIIDSACNGLGAAIIERRLVEEELQDERLVAPFGWHEIKGGFGCYLPASRRNKPEVIAFIEWLQSVA